MKHIKLDQLGFSAHIILPIVVVVVVATLGIRLLGIDNAQTPPTKLVAIGGSIIAGAGASPTSYDEPAGSRCARTINSFALLTAQAKKLTLEQFACSGATMANDIFGSQTSGTVTQPTQLSQAAPYISGNDVIVMVGGNDTGWIGDLTDCESKAGCPTGQAPDNAAFQASLTVLQQHLTSLMTQLKQRGAYKVLVDGYYPIADYGAVTDPTCSYKLTNADISWMNARLAALNSALATTAKATGAIFVNPTAEFTGKGVCTAQEYSYIQGAQQVNAAGHEINTATTANFAAHPDANGQNELAKLNEAAL